MAACRDVAIAQQGPNCQKSLSVMFLPQKGIIPAEIGEASEVTVCSAEGQPMLDGQRRQMRIRQSQRRRSIQPFIKPKMCSLAWANDETM
jgi:hypothetical protein